ncbi:MAG: transcription antitermination factor NusB [Bacteroidales bacterium]|nr:transcription antitermination factor NusB [Bacteroidales bacterium]MBP5134507.1 transcription antitermination factor NusB [Paludibacteraceae bacterium]
MINRTLLRIKIVQTVYSYYLNRKETSTETEDELFRSIKQTYNLYIHLLSLITEITSYAQNKIEIGKNKYRPTKEELNPNTRFANNSFALQLSQNKTLLQIISDENLSWENERDVVKNLFTEIEQADFFKEYMKSETTSYQEDKDVWRKIFKRIIPFSENLGESLEDKNLYWNDDAETVISFVIKTIKQFEEPKGENQELLPMFKDKEDVEFAKTLLHKSIFKERELRELINENTKNWDLDRIAFMDIVIMQVALTEIMNFPRIPVNVSMNEYIEIAKTYSTEKSGAFVNGILDKIISILKKENKITKVTLV